MNPVDPLRPRTIEPPRPVSSDPGAARHATGDPTRRTDGATDVLVLLDIEADAKAGALDHLDLDVTVIHLLLSTFNDNRCDGRAVLFRIRGLPLPPRPEALARAVEPAPEEAAPRPEPEDGSWSAWSDPIRGLSSRISLPRRASRGRRLAGDMELRFDPAGLSPEVTHFDAYGLERGVRLLLRNPADGRECEVRAVDGFDGPPDPPRSWEFEKDLPADRAWCFPIRECGAREVRLTFPLATVWKDLLPGPWEARVSVTVEEPDDADDLPPHAEGTPAPVTWIGSFRTEPLSIDIEQPAKRTLRYLVPHRLRLVPELHRPWIAVGCLSEDREAVTLEAREGLSLGVHVRRDGVGGDRMVGGQPWLDVADRQVPEHPGPFARDYEIVIFETGEEPGYHRDLDPGHPSYRALWKGTFRVEATAAEVEALRR